MRLIFNILMLVFIGVFSLQGSEHYSPKVVVIGGGLAGLTTAYRLQESGYDVNLYEARGRLGGRVLTINLAGNPAELGGQNILNGGDSKNILSLIDELGLEVESSKMLLHFYYFNGSEMFDTDLLLENYNFTPEELEERLKNICNTADNMQDVLEELFSDNENLIKSFSAMLAAYEGLPPEHLSLDAIETLYHMILGGLSAAHQSASEEEDVYMEHMWVKGGNQKLIDKLAEKLNGRIQLDSPLISLKKTASHKYELTFKGGKKVEADLVVLAIPCTVYEDIEFGINTIHPKKLEGIKSIQYGTNSKILIPVNSSKNSDTGSYTNGCMMTWFPGEFHTICAFYVGNYGNFNPEMLQDVYQRVLPLLEKAYCIEPNLPAPVYAADEAYAHYDGPVGYSWPNDPYAKGSYSCITAAEEEIFTAIQDWDGEKVKVLFEPIDNTLFFAGEHTSILLEVDGTLEAAVESGERAARIIKRR